MLRASVWISVGRAAVFSAICLVGILAGLKAEAGRPVIAIFAPGTSLAEALGTAGTIGIPVLAYGSVSWVIALDARDAAARAALRARGALLLLDADKAARVCGLQIMTL